jgi:hypothetical protein
MSKTGSKLDKDTVSKTGRYLFEIPDDDSQALDMRTRVNSAKSMQALIFYSALSEILGSDYAKKIKDSMQRLLIAHNGLGREEGVKILMQNFPKLIRIDTGIEPQED